MFGLDIDILKALEIDDLLEESKQEEVKQPETTDMMNKTMTELREEHGMEPSLNTAANKLRRRCNYYKSMYAEDNAEAAARKSSSDEQ